ncbi:hypothetical protein [Streptomyces sp. TBY4]|uniref:lectin-like domain-containing protein n=1 Tax=Streptomyces sp. TBY4 TaxID=2962030 RepID=UPI0020B67895|nr:hypothetical protein [Streptomyces sp. TBY4]MCP3759693.1 hypothetical protein [Streptomyces sp. TBY4]
MSQYLLAESFADVTVSSMMWQATVPQGTGVPGLTAAPSATRGSLRPCGEITSGSMKPDAAGEGVFRLTGNSRQSSCHLLLEQVIDTRRGVTFEFDLYMYDAQTIAGPNGMWAADGVAFHMIDGEQRRVEAGEAGGALGYKSLSGAYASVAFDQFGNFSAQAAGAGGPGRSPNTVAVRGGQSTGYAYLIGAALDPKAQALSVDSATERALAKRHVIVDLTSAGLITVRIDWLDGKGPQQILTGDLDGLPGQAPLPSMVKIGWSASTGDAPSVHEISGFTASTL